MPETTTEVKTESKQKKLFDILSEKELDRIQQTDIRNCYITDITISEVLHLRYCLDNQPYLRSEEVVEVILKRAGI